MTSDNGKNDPSRRKHSNSNIVSMKRGSTVSGRRYTSRIYSQGKERSDGSRDDSYGNAFSEKRSYADEYGSGSRSSSDGGADSAAGLQSMSLSSSRSGRRRNPARPSSERTGRTNRGSRSASVSRGASGTAGANHAAGGRTGPADVYRTERRTEPADVRTERRRTELSDVRRERRRTEPADVRRERRRTEPADVRTEHRRTVNSYVRSDRKRTETAGNREQPGRTASVKSKQVSFPGNQSAGNMRKVASPKRSSVNLRAILFPDPKNIKGRDSQPETSGNPAGSYAAAAAGTFPWFVSRRGRAADRTAPRDYYDYNLLAVVILLTCFGLVMLYSTSAYEAAAEYGSDFYYFRRQALISAVSVVIAVFISQIDYHRFIRWDRLIYILSIILLVATRYVGREANGARRWIYLGPIHFQPAELAKLAVIMLMPELIVQAGRKFKGIRVPLKVMFPGLLSAVCTYYFTQNLSSAVIIAAITIGLAFVVYPKTGRFLAVIGTVLGVVVVAVIIMLQSGGASGNFRLSRIEVWLHPESDTEKSYQSMQALYAIGSGGFFGKGLGNSTQKLGNVPEAQNDMIFSIICEELGLFGAIVVIILFVFLLYRLFFIARNAPDLLGSLIATGIFVHIALQVILNIAVVTRFIPTTGITLPFISYGGSSIVFLMAEMGLALSISKQIEFR